MPDQRFPFSNVHPAKIMYKGYVFPSVEHFFQAMKFPESEWASMIRMTWQQTKAKGKDTSFRPNWHDIKYQVMEWGLRQKFRYGTDNANKLIAHGDPLVEWNYWHDNDWGNCTCGRLECQVEGQNNLGKILTRIRDDLIKELRTK